MEQTLTFKTQIRVLGVQKSLFNSYTATIQCAETGEIFEGVYYPDGSEVEWEARQNAVREAIWVMLNNNFNHDIDDHEHPAIYDLF